MKVLDLGKPPCEVIIGQGNFSLKTVEYLRDAMLSSAPNVSFGVAMNDGSGRVTRYEGNDEDLKEKAIEYAMKIGAGHVFVICFKNAFPVHVLNNIKMVPTVVSIYVATSNPIRVVIYEEGEQRAVLGVMDGYTTKERENVEERKELLRRLGLRE